MPIFFTISKFFDPGNQAIRIPDKQASRQPGNQATRPPGTTQQGTPAWSLKGWWGYAKRKELDFGALGFLAVDVPDGGLDLLLDAPGEAEALGLFSCSSEEWLNHE